MGFNAYLLIHSNVYMIYLQKTIILPRNYGSIISSCDYIVYMLIIYDCMIYHRISLYCYISYIHKHYE